MKPDAPTGEASGVSGIDYEYRGSKTDDPDGDHVLYKWSFGDGGEGTWLLPGGESGEIYEVNHTWDEKGEYEIRVKAKDEHGAESEWSDPLPVSMPRNKLSTRHS